ncbi:unnamed protein product [Durusdinium trenchii]|uniref:Uncharacterized protein n=1 Tax=Durusdinium trenchii TaxID=1381693 RepID=A0ABP0Q9T9_9DINO
MESSILVRLLQVQAPKVWIATVLLLLWQSNLVFTEGGNIDFIEIFSGQAKVTQYWSEQGYRCCKVDLDYDECMDFNACGGFLLCAHLILNQVPDRCNLLAPVCGSWSAVSRGSTLRSYINPMGRHCPSVDSGNRMVSRCVLLILLMMSKNLRWLLEQPHQSLLPRHKRMEWLLNRVVFVHIVYFWMMHYNKKSPKRSMMLSNMSSISMLDLGVLTKKQRDIPDRLETTCKYLDKDGILRYQGNKQLKSTQFYSREFGKKLLEVYQAAQADSSRLDLRTRPEIDSRKTDRELFENLPLGDIWYESDCHKAFEYLYNSKYLRIPTSWAPTIQSFRTDLLEEVKRIESNPDGRDCI